MRERILQLEQGKIDQPRAKVSFSVNEIEDTLFPGDVWNTTIQIKSQNHVPIRGMIHSLNPAVTVTPSQIDGIVQRVNIQVKVPAYSADGKMEGVIEWVTDAGEYVIPYQFFIVDRQEFQDEVCFRTLEQLTQEAKLDFEATARVFASSSFLKMPLMQSDLKLQSLYRSVFQGGNWRRALEDFLVYTGQKKPISVKLKSDMVVFREGEETKIVLTKSEWGYLSLQVGAERTGFVNILPYKPTYQAGCYEISLEANTQRLHAGKNQCFVTITTNQQTLRVMTMKQMPSKYTPRRALLVKPWMWQDEKQQERIEQFIFRDWSEYQGVWNIWKLILEQKLEEAANVRAQIQTQMEAQKEENPWLYAVWMMEGAYVTYGVQKTQILQWLKSYAEEQRDVFVLFLYCHAAESVIDRGVAEQLYEQGCRSPYLYHMIFQRWEKLSGESDWKNWNINVSYQVIAYILRNHLEKTSLLGSYFGELKKHRNYRPMLFDMLCVLYQKTQDNAVLEKIVQLLIYSRKVKASYFEWFELAIVHDLKVIGLYEAFLNTVPREYGKPFPYMLLYYYTYNSDIAGVLKEKIYQNVAQYYEREDRLVELYMPQMQEYVTMRILRKEFSAYLCRVYERVISSDVLDEDLAEGVLDLCYAWNIYVHSDRIRNVVIRYPQMEGEWIYAVREQQVCLPIYDEEAVILFLDRFGNCQVNVKWEKERVPMSDAIRDCCIELLPHHISQSLEKYHCLVENGIDGEEMLGWAEWLLGKKANLCIQAKLQIQTCLIEYCSEHPQEHRYDELLLHVDVGSLAVWSCDCLIRALVGRNFWLRAYEVLQQVGVSTIPPESLLVIADAMIAEKKDEKDDFLVFLAYHLLEENVANHRVIEYLNHFLEGGNQTLYSVFLQSRKSRIDYDDLLPNMMVQSLFSGNFEWLEEIAPIYCEREDADSHVKCAAYLVGCHQFLVHQRNLDVPTVTWLMQEADKQILLVRLAWISYVAEHPQVESDLRSRALDYLKECCEQGIWLASFAKLVEDEEVVPEPLEGRVIVEAHASPHKNVFLEYTLCQENGECFNSPMKEVYPGIYTLAVTVFSDEQLQSHATVESTAGTDLSESLQVMCSKPMRGNHASTYTELEQIIERSVSITHEEAKEMMKELARKKKMVEKLFPYKG